MYYVEHCPYGTNTVSDGDRLYRFDTREDVAAYIESVAEGTAREVTEEEAERRYNTWQFEYFDDAGIIWED